MGTQQESSRPFAGSSHLPGTQWGGIQHPKYWPSCLPSHPSRFHVPQMQGTMPHQHRRLLGWEIHLEFRGILQLIRFQTFRTPEFSSEFYFSDCKMCSRQFWTCFFRFGILSCHWLFQFHESEKVPAINVSGEWHQISIYSMHQLFSCAPLPSHCSWYLLDTHKN